MKSMFPYFFGVDFTCLVLFEGIFLYLIWHAGRTVDEFSTGNMGLNLAHSSYDVMIEHIGNEMIMPLKLTMVIGLFVFMATCLAGLVTSILFSFDAFPVLALTALCLGILLLTGSGAVRVNSALRKRFLALVS